jgi:nitroreductase
MTRYETIFVRRSVRQYDFTPLDDALLSEIQQVVDQARQLPGQSARFEIVNDHKLRENYAPYAILAYSERADMAKANIGYTLQGVDLYLQSMGLGSLWTASSKPAEQAADYRIMLAFGQTNVPLRTGESEFRREPIPKISNEDNPISRAARLAPSAANFQPWKLDFSPGKVKVQANGRGISKLIVGKYQKIDLGIMVKHVELALQHEGKTVTALTEQDRGKTFAIEVSYA